jgi:predicted nucleic acid-binding protein
MGVNNGLGAVGTWVVDASVAFAWFAAVPDSAQAALLLEPHWQHVLIAPDLILVELLNAGWKSWRLGAITDQQLAWLANRAREPFNELFKADMLLSRAHHWCTTLDHPAYDCLYIALAEMTNATLISADQRLLRKLQDNHPGVPASLPLSLLARFEAVAASSQSSSEGPWSREALHERD